MHPSEIRTFRIGDAALILLFALGAVFFGLSLHGSGLGKTALLMEGNALPKSFSLSRDTVLCIVGPVGKTEVSMKNGQVWISSASCPRQVCRHQGKIRLNGQILVCLPNRLIIEIKGSEEPVVDATTE